ncbi:MAG: imelysin family protein [Rhizobium sp.]
MRSWTFLAAGLFLATTALSATTISAMAQQAAPASPTAPAQSAHADPMNEAAVAGVMQKAVDAVIRPAYASMHASAAGLTTAMRSLCSTPSPAAATTARRAFAETIAAWSKIEIVQVGPVLDKNRFEHILFYPDRKGIGMKQVQALIAKADDKDTTVTDVAKKSVALQSLTALEYVLYGTGSETLATDKNGFRCRYGAAVAGNIEQVSGQLASEWDDPKGVSSSWKAPGKDSADFMDNKEAITALLGILVHGAENVRDQRLETFYKGDPAAARPHMAIYWRSQNTWPSLMANIEGLQALWQKAGMADLLPPAKRAIAAKIDGLLAQLITTAGSINPNVEAAIADPAERAKIDRLRSDARDLTTDFSDGFGVDIGLSAGFSFADGD